MKRFVLLVAIIMCVFLTGCNLQSRESEKTEQLEVTATITSKLKHRHVIKVDNGNRTYRLCCKVRITYEDVSEIFQHYNEDVEVGDTIQMILHKVYDKDGNLVSQTLHFPE